MLSSSRLPENSAAGVLAMLTVHLYLPWAHSLKEKRMACAGLAKKLRQRFNVTTAEIDCQDMQQTFALGVAALAANTAQADSVLDRVLAFIESNTEAEVSVVSREFR